MVLGVATAIFSFFHRLFLFLLVFSSILGAFVNKCFVISVLLAIRPHVCIKIYHFPLRGLEWNNIWEIYIILSQKKLMFGKINPKLAGTVYEELREFMALSCWIFLGLWKVSLRRICREKLLTIFFCEVFFFSKLSRLRDYFTINMAKPIRTKK
jgi:hypothetical protein